jgi:hypothetical protein
MAIHVTKKAFQLIMKGLFESDLLSTLVYPTKQDKK